MHELRPADLDRPTNFPDDENAAQNRPYQHHAPKESGGLHHSENTSISKNGNDHYHFSLSAIHDHRAL
jgi:hypothetical protein